MAFLKFGKKDKKKEEEKESENKKEDKLIEKPRDIDSIIAKNLMKTDFIILHPKATVKEATKIFLDNELDEIPIVDNRNVIGILTERDFLRAVEEISFSLGTDVQSEEYEKRLEKLGKKSVEEVSRKDVSVGESTGLFDVIITMDENGLETIPVVDNSNKIVGVIYKQDIVKELWRFLS